MGHGLGLPVILAMLAQLAVGHKAVDRVAGRLTHANPIAASPFPQKLETSNLLSNASKCGKFPVHRTFQASGGCYRNDDSYFSINYRVYAFDIRSANVTLITCDFVDSKGAGSVLKLSSVYLIMERCTASYCPLFAEISKSEDDSRIDYSNFTKCQFTLYISSMSITHCRFTPLNDIDHPIFRITGGTSCVFRTCSFVDFAIRAEEMPNLRLISCQFRSIQEHPSIKLTTSALMVQSSCFSASLKAAIQFDEYSAVHLENDAEFGRPECFFSNTTETALLPPPYHSRAGTTVAVLFFAGFIAMFASILVYIFCNCKEDPINPAIGLDPDSYEESELELSQ
jgi:hypothetical protein